MIKQFKVIIYLLFISTLFLSGLDTKNRTNFLLQQEREWLDNLQRPLKVGITEIPNQVLKTNNGYQGFSIDLFKKIEHLLGIKFEYVYYKTWDALIFAGTKREVDIIFSAQKTERQISYYDFTDSILKQQNKIIITGDKLSYKSIEDLFGKKVAVVGGSAIFEYLKLNYPKIILTPTKSEYEALKITYQEMVDCAISEIVPASYYMKQLNHNTNLHIIGDIGYDYNLRIASRNDRPILNIILSKTVETIPSSYIETLQLKWGYINEVNHKLLQRINTAFLILLALVLLWVEILRRDNKKLQQILDSSIAAMAIFKNGRCIQTNKVLLAQSGYTKKEVLGKEIKDFVDASDHKELEERIKTSQDEYEITLIGKDGTTYPALVKGTIIKGNRRISSFIDISEIKKAQEELEQFNITLEQKIQYAVNKNKKQEQMLSQQSRLAQMGEAINMIAHQWRQPLSNINGLVMKMDIKSSKRDDKGDFSLDAELDEIESICAYMSHTIDDFRDFFKPEKSKIQFNLKETIETTFKLLQPTLHYAEIEIYHHYNDEIILLGYPNELGQVIINIINNAKDALISNNQNREKHITLNLYKEKERAVLTIEDNAGGIEDDIINNIFNPYFSTKVKKSGTGLGLYISKMIIEEHMGGELSVKNSDDGAIFKISFKL